MSPKTKTIHVPEHSWTQKQSFEKRPRFFLLRQLLRYPRCQEYLWHLVTHGFLLQGNTWVLTWQPREVNKCLSLFSSFWSSSLSWLLSTFLSLFFGSSTSQPTVANSQHLLRAFSHMSNVECVSWPTCVKSELDLPRQTWLPQNPLYHRPPRPQAATCGIGMRHRWITGCKLRMTRVP